jgi:uncharacterized repeat protein (TIGR01451 family)/fimbrial isopeptide formation D2 family protein
MIRALIAMLLLTAALAGAAPSADAAGTPDLALTADAPAQTLAGDDVPVRLTATTPAASPTARNLSYRVVLPGGSSYVTGSADAAAGEPEIIGNAPVAGQTTLIWRDLADIAADTTHELGFSVRPSTSTFGVNTTFSLTADAYVTDDPRYVPAFTATGQHDATVAHPSTGWDTGRTASVQMRAMTISQSATNQPDGELLRGVHDHQSVVTLTLRGSTAGGTSSIVLDHYLPAGVEYLGCGGAGADHTTNAATNPGQIEEYPGAGPITVPAVAGCTAPSTVVTGTYDPPGAQPSGTYTRVRWSISSLGAGATQTYSFAVAIPLRANTLTWTSATPATTGAQAANLDNNSGAEITDETTLTDATNASGQYVGLISTSAQQESSRTAEDLAISKQASSSTLAPGATTQWDLTVRTSEYRSAANVVITDTVPDGLCPLDAGGSLATTPDASDLAECDSAPSPSIPYASATEASDGSYALSWDSTSDPSLAELAPNATTTLSYTTRTRGHYQEGFADDVPVGAGDVARNAAQVGADARVICAGGVACPGGAPTGDEIDHDGGLTSHITDDADAALTGATGSADKQVALSGNDCTVAAYTQGVPSYAPGDRVCWLVQVGFPTGIESQAALLTDQLPAGLQLDTAFGSGGDERTASDDVGASTFDGSAAIPGPGGALSWTLPTPYAPAGGTFEHRVATRLQLPTGGTDGMLVENRFRASIATAGGPLEPLRDTAEVQLRMPVLSITERIVAVDGSPITATATQTIRGGEVITYRLRVSNTGGRDAEQLEAWDRLPAGLTCADVVAVSSAGACAGDVLRWGAAPTTGPTVPAAGSADLTFDVLVPTTVEVGQSLVTTSGVRTYQSATNTGGAYAYVPASNIDPTTAGTENVPAVGSTATITGATPTITESRATSLTETGNASTSATIGETVTYTVSGTVPAGLTVRELAITDAIDTRHTYVGGTLQQTGGPAMTLGMAGSTITLSLPTSYTAPTGTDTTFTFTFDTLVADMNGNTRGGPSLINQALLKYTPYGTANGGTQTQLSATQMITPIVEPALTLTKVTDVGVTPVVGGQIVQYTVTLGTSSGTAHESTLVDHVPTGTTPLNTAGDPIADGESTTSGGVWDEAARTLTFSPSATIVQGSPDVFTYRAVVNIPVTAGEHLTNTVDATTTSLPGTDPAERTSASTVTAGYVSSASVTLVAKTPSVTKTSDTNSRTPGERVRYTVDVTLPENAILHDVHVRDTLPDAIDFDGYLATSSASCISGCTPGNEPVIQPYDPVTNGDGTMTIAWDLGDLLTEEPTPRTIRLQYDAHLRATHRAGGANVIRGQTATNSVRVMSDRTDKVGAFDAATLPAPGGGFDDTSTVANRTVTVVEPGVSLDKQIAIGAGAYGNGPVTIHDGDTLAYRVTITNTGNSPLYDVAVQDTPDAGLRNVQLAAGLTTTANTDGFTAGDPQMTWLVPGPIAAGASVVLQYTADLPVITALTDGQHLDNSAQVTSSWGVAEATRLADGFIYRSYTTGADTTRANYDAPTLTLTKTTGAGGFPESAQAEVGQAFTWRIMVTNTSTTETATQLTFHDTLPPNWRYVPSSASVAPGGSTTPTIVSDPGGDELTFATGLSLAPGASRTLTYQARPLLAAATTPGTGAGNPHVNTASAEVRNQAGATGDAGGLFTSPSDTAQAILAVPTLGIDVTPDSGSAIPGTATSFTVHVTNAGLVGMTNVQLQATMPTQTLYAPGSATASPSTGFSETAATTAAATWHIASIAAGASVDLTVPFTLDPGLATGAQLVLTVDGSSDQTTNNVIDDGDRTLVRSADLDASITATPNPATAGATLTYDIGAANAGPSAAKDVSLSLPLPTTVSFRSAPAGCTYAAGPRTVTCAWTGDLAPGDDVAAAVVVDVDPAATTNASATVTADGADADPAGANDAASVTVPIGTSADLRMTKTVSPTSIGRGANATFTLRLDNDGPSTAVAAQVVDTLPAGLTYLSDDGGCSAAGQVVTCPAAALAPGASRTVHIVARGDATGTLVNSATASTSTSDPTPSNDTATATLTVRPLADLQLTMSAPATLAAGGTMPVSLTLTNNGPDPASSVTIVATIPAGTVFAGGDPGCTASGRTITCTVGGGLASGANASRQISVQVPTALGDQLLSTTGSGASAEVDPGGATASASTQIGPSADLSVQQGGDATVVAGEDAQLTFTVSNAGPSPAANVELTAELPNGVSPASIVPPAGMSCAIAGQVITCTMPSLPAGQSATVAVTVGVPSTWAGGQFRTLMRAATTTPDPNAANASADRDTAVTAPPTPAPAPDGGTPSGNTGGAPAGGGTPSGPAANVPQTSVSLKLKSSKKKLRGGSTVQYTITVTNTGKHKATGLRVCDRLPQWMAFASTGSGFMSGAQLCFRTKELAPGDRVVEKVTAKVSRRAKKGAILIGRASVEVENAKTASGSVKGTVVTDGRVKAESVKGFTG